jgi:hypothetical protein
VGSEEAQATLVDLALPASLGVVGSGSTISVGSIPPGQSKDVKIRLVVDSSASEGTEEIRYMVIWSNVDGEESSRQGGFAATLTGEARVVIQRIDIDPPKLESRARGTLQVTVRNPGTQQVSDIALQLLGVPELFTETLLPIGSLLPAQTDSVVFGMFVDPEVKEGVYAVTVTVTYLDASGAEQVESTVVDLRIYKRETIFSWVNLVILVGVIAALAILYIVFGEYLSQLFGNDQRHREVS